jgi:hypothetical protein
VHDVLVGETAIWWTTINGDVTVSQVAVTSTPKVARPVPATAVLTSQRPVFLADAIGPMTEIRGTVTNTGTTEGNLSIELQANTGEVGSASAFEVPVGQTVPWVTTADGTGTFRIVRITTSPPPIT